jgi:hypothetical protein
MCQSVEERIGPRIIALPRGADEARDGGEEDKSAQRPVPTEVVEMPGGIELGSKDLVQPFRRHGGQHAVIEGTGGMEDGGIFALRRAGEPPEGGVGEVEDVFVGPGGDSAPGQQHQPRGRQAVVGDPGLQQGEAIRGGAMRGGGSGKRHCRKGNDHQAGHCRTLLEVGLQRGEIGMAPKGQRRIIDALLAEDGAKGRLGRGEGRRGPLQVVKRALASAEPALQLLRGDRPGGQGLDRGDRLTGGVGDGERDRPVLRPV